MKCNALWHAVNLSQKGIWPCIQVHNDSWDLLFIFFTRFFYLCTSLQHKKSRGYNVDSTYCLCNSRRFQITGMKWVEMIKHGVQFVPYAEEVPAHQCTGEHHDIQAEHTCCWLLRADALECEVEVLLFFLVCISWAWRKMIYRSTSCRFRIQIFRGNSLDMK